MIIDKNEIEVPLLEAENSGVVLFLWSKICWQPPLLVTLYSQTCSDTTGARHTLFPNVLWHNWC